MPDRSDPTMVIPPEADPDLGPCCICRGRDGVQTIVLLPYANAIPGHGWGCALCDLPLSGATAVLCDGCAPGYRAGDLVLSETCRGYPAEDGREPFATTRGRTAVGHDASAHAEVGLWK